MFRLCALLLLAGLVSGQSILRVPSFGPPETLDPQLRYDQHHLRYFAQIFESPFEMGLDDKGLAVLRPAVCTLPEISEDGRSLILRLNRGVRFHDDPCFEGGKGREVTLEDLRYTFLRLADPRTESPMWALIEGSIKGLDAWREKCKKQKFADYDVDVAGLQVGEGRFTIRLSSPYPVLPALLTQPWASVLPREALRKYGSSFGERPVGTGPFRFKAWDALGTVRLVKNPSYRISTKPYVDELRFESVPVEKVASRFFEGYLDIIDTLGKPRNEIFDARGRLKSKLRREGYTIADAVPLQLHYMTFGFKNKYLAMKPIRQAICLAIDRQAFIDRVFGGRCRIADSPIPPVFPETVVADQVRNDLTKRDVKRARGLLAKAGFPGGEGLPEFILDVPSAVELMPDTRRGVEGMVANLAEIGIKAQVRTETFGTFLDRAKRGQVQMGWVSWFADYPDVENFLLLFRGAEPGSDDYGYNYGHYGNEEYDRLYRRMARLYPGPQRNLLIEKMLRILVEDVPWVTIGYPIQSLASRPGVQGVKYNLLNFSYRDVWVQEKKKR